MPNIYVSKKVKEKLDKFIKSSRISPEFGAKNKYPSPNKAIEFLLKIGLKFPLEALEKMSKQKLIEFKLKMSDSEFEEFERKGELRKFIEEKFEKEEEGSENGE